MFFEQLKKWKHKTTITIKKSKYSAVTYGKQQTIPIRNTLSFDGNFTEKSRSEAGYKYI